LFGGALIHCGSNYKHFLFVENIYFSPYPLARQMPDAEDAARLKGTVAFLKSTACGERG
jgi:hypothetical protein